jgi:monoamine oxidase
MSSQLTRRQVIGRAVGAGAGLAIGPVAYSQPRAAAKVIVLGGGLAGLTAADELITAGAEATVLEARSRPGGRVFTLRKPFSDGLYSEAGALFIPANHDLTIGLARRLNLKLSVIPQADWDVIFYLNGQRVLPDRQAVGAYPVTLTTEERRAGLMGMEQYYIARGAADLGDFAGKDWPPESLKQLDQMSFYDYLKQQGASPGAIQLMRATSYDLEGEGIEGLSALHMLRGVAGSRIEDKVYNIQGGNDLLPRGLADKLGDKVVLGAEVRRIDRNKDGVEVLYQLNGVIKSIKGDYIVCTLPFSVLKSIEVRPEWTMTKRRAIDDMPYTNVTRVYLQCKQKFWRKMGLPGHAATDLPIQWVWETTGTQPGPRGIMHTYSTGKHARAIQAMSQEKRVSYVAEELEKVFPGTQANMESGASFSWDEEPYNKGGYCYFKPGQIFGLLPNATKPDDRVHFAGEHVSPYPGWMQGAIHSGKRAAKEILSLK